MSKKILGLDLGSNSIGWALLLADEQQNPVSIIDLGARIFTKAVEEKTPTPKNVARRNARLTRRVLQRRTRRKQRMLNYLISLALLPETLKQHVQPEKILNTLGDPYQLRAKALDEKLEAYELGRVIYHLVQRRGFLSSRKTLLGDMIDDPDVQAVLNELEEQQDNTNERAKEETAFKKDINILREKIALSGCRTLGEYLAGLAEYSVKRNRRREGGHLRTDRQMYRDELELIWNKQREFHSVLSDDVYEQIENIIFYQRPLKLKEDRVGRCSLEPSCKRAHIAKLEYQKYRYLHDINNLKYFDAYSEESHSLSDDEKAKLIELFEQNKEVSFSKIKKTLNFDKYTEFNFENGNKKLKGNITACEIRRVLPQWDHLTDQQQKALVEDLLTIRKKSVLKKRLITHWDFDKKTAVELCLLEFEPGHGNLSIKAINKLLPFMQQGLQEAEARKKAGYRYEEKSDEVVDKLPVPPEIANPIVSKALSELRRLINAIIVQYGKPDIIRIEMARDLEMNTKRYKAYLQQQKENSTANDKAVDEYRAIADKNPSLGLTKYPSKIDKIKYRLWQDQKQCCAYSGKTISLTQLFSAETEVDHIVPYSQSLDDSYMNKVVCFSAENRYKGQRTPKDAFAGNEEKWNQLTQALQRWDKKRLKSKIDRFYMTAEKVIERDFISSQLNDTRYISKVALAYVRQLACDVTVSKGITTAWMRHNWDLNSLLGETDQKERTDHRHHAIDAVVIACIDRRLYNTIVRIAAEIEKNTGSQRNMSDIYIDAPWPDFRQQLDAKLQQTIVSIAPQRKLSGALHEETGAGFIDGIGNVNRIDLDANFKEKWLEDIIDKTVSESIRKHLARYNNDPKKAFAEGVTVYHKNGRVPIRRVRALQSKTSLKELEKTKLGIKDKQGNIFKWLAYGNMHHVEVLRHKKSGKVYGEFVTMMEAARRARSIGGLKQPIVKTEHGEDLELLMSLYINDTVSVIKKGEKRFYRVQKLDVAGNRIMLRLCSAATLKNKDEGIFMSLNADNLQTYQLAKEQINVLGKPLISAQYA